MEKITASLREGRGFAFVVLYAEFDGKGFPFRHGFGSGQGFSRLFAQMAIGGRVEAFLRFDAGQAVLFGKGECRLTV